MHAFRSKSEVQRFVFASWLLLGLWCGWLVAAGWLVVASISLRQGWLLLWLLEVLVMTVLSLIWLFSASRARCPLCVARPLFPERCSRHQRAAVWLGSPRLPVAFNIAFQRKFHCPYCGEPTSMRVRRSHLKNRI